MKESVLSFKDKSAQHWFSSVKKYFLAMKYR